MNAKNKITVVFRNDDPSACSLIDHERAIASIFERYGFVQTIGVVPMRCEGDPHDPGPQRCVRLNENPAMVEFLRNYAACSGSEIALHGCTHQNNRLSRPLRRENFEFSGLELSEQQEMIARGTDIIATSLGVRPTTFIPPWNRLDHNTVEACLHHKYRLISSGPHTPVRNGIKSLGMNCELATFAPMLQHARSLDCHSLLVLTYHSRFITPEKDLDLLEQSLNLCAETPNLEVLTLAQTAEQYPDLVSTANEAAANTVAQWQLPATSRSKARLYLTALRRLGLKTRLEQQYRTARRLYADARYSQAAEITGTIDRLSRRLLASARLAIFLVSAILGAVIWLISSAAISTYRLYPCIALICATLAAAALARSRMTNSDTMSETRNAALLSVAGVLTAVTIAEAVVLITN